jgi:hypothetical protein
VFGATASQWAIYDAYLADQARQAALKEKKAVVKKVRGGAWSLIYTLHVCVCLDVSALTLSNDKRGKFDVVGGCPR